MTTTLLSPAITSVHDAPVRSLRTSTITAVETRKMLDTRGAHALLAGIVALAGAMVLWQLKYSDLSAIMMVEEGAKPPRAPFSDYLIPATWIVAFGAPILGLLSMSSEWTRRTALNTFALAPRRRRVLAAKTVSALGISLGTFGVVLAMSLGAAALGDATFHGAAGQIGWCTAIVVLNTLVGLGLGAVSGQTSVALGGFLAAPAAIAVATLMIPSGDSLRNFDLVGAYQDLIHGPPFWHSAQTFTAIALWATVPLAVGIRRSVRREAK